jgi:hypothetical protein
MQSTLRWIATLGRTLGILLVVALPGVYSALARAAEPSVPYVPTPQDVVERMLEMAKVTASDYVIDLGSGDGRIVITAAKKFGARGFGVDLNPERVAEANANARRAGVADRVAFYQRDLFETDLGDATVITMYLLPRVNLELRPKLLTLKPGVRVVSHDFDMGEWKPDAHVEMRSPEKYGGAGGKSDIYLWIIPARVAGTWEWQMPVRGRSVRYGAQLVQTFQMISGSASAEGRRVALQNARLRGEQIRFAFTAELDGEPVKHEFTGKVDGDRIVGTARLSGGRLQAQLDWIAQRGNRSAQSVVSATAGLSFLSSD